MKLMGDTEFSAKKMEERNRDRIMNLIIKIIEKKIQIS